MTDQYIPIRQQLPGQTVTHINGRQLPTPMMISDDEASDLSFESILNRNQDTQNQLNSMPQSYMTHKNNHAGIVQSNQPSPQDAFRPAGIPPLQNVHQDSTFQTQDLPPQAVEIINQASADIPQGEDLYQIMIANAQEYQTMKDNGHLANPGMQSNPMTQGLYNSQHQPISPSIHPLGNAQSSKKNVQITPSYTNVNVQELARQPINADLMQNQASVTGNRNSSNPFSSALSMQPQSTDGSKALISDQLAIHDNAQNPLIAQNEISRYQNSVSPTLMDLNKQSSQDSEDSSEQISSRRPNAMDATGLFFKNIASGVTLGFYHPPEEPKPEGFMRVIEPIKSLVWDAPKSLLIDVPVGIAHAIGKQQHDEEIQQDQRNQLNSDKVAYNSPIRERHSSKPWMNRHFA